MTVHTLVRSTGRRGWTVAFAETNEWIVGERTWCPMCAATHTARRTA
ncbi:hypothetical protein [Rhodococcus wratislaviensis]